MSNQLNTGNEKGVTSSKKEAPGDRSLNLEGGIGRLATNIYLSGTPAGRSLTASTLSNAFLLHF